MPARRIFMLTALTASAAACTRSEPFQAKPLVPPNGTPVRLTVASTEAIDRRDPAAIAADFFTRRRDDRLAEAAVGLLRDRVQAAGGAGVARAEVLRAVIVEKPLATDGSWFSRLPEAELEATLSTRIVVLDEAGIELAAALTEVVRGKPVPRGSGAVERDQIGQALMAEILADLDSGLQQSVKANLGAYVLL